MSGLDELFEKVTATANIQGSWFTVRWQPDVAIGESLNIGVGFVGNQGEFSLKLLDDFERLRCLYDYQKFEFHADLACRIVSELMQSDPYRRGDLTSGISVHDQGFAQGADIESIVSQLFESAVTLARPRPGDAKKKPFRPVSRENAYDHLRTYLKRSLELQFEAHVRDHPVRKIKDQFGESELYLPFERKRGVASLASAAYADVWRADSQLYEGFRHVETALKEELSDEAALFVVLPGSGFPPEAAKALEPRFDQFYTFVKRHGIQIESHVDLDELGESVVNWCRAEAA